MKSGNLVLKRKALEEMKELTDKIGLDGLKSFNSVFRRLSLR